MDSNNRLYDSIAGFVIIDATGCSLFCAQYASPDLVGFTFLATQPGAGSDCYCYFDGGKVPTPPSGSDWFEIHTGLLGTGPIKGSSSPSDTDFTCYAFP